MTSEARTDAWRLGDRVTLTDYADRYTPPGLEDCGTVVRVWKEQVKVAWDSGSVSWASGSGLTLLLAAGDVIDPGPQSGCVYEAVGFGPADEPQAAPAAERAAELRGNLNSWLKGCYYGLSHSQLLAWAVELYASGWMPPDLEERLPPVMVAEAKGRAGRIDRDDWVCEVCGLRATDEGDGSDHLSEGGGWCPERTPVHLGDLAGADGNAFAIVGVVREALAPNRRAAFHEQATSGDYQHLLDTVESWCVDLDGAIPNLRGGE